MRRSFRLRNHFQKDRIDRKVPFVVVVNVNNGSATKKAAPGSGGVVGDNNPRPALIVSLGFSHRSDSPT